MKDAKDRKENGKLQEAIELLNEAIEIRLKLFDGKPESSRVLMTLYCDMAFCHENLENSENYIEAIEFNEKALIEYKKCGVFLEGLRKMPKIYESLTKCYMMSDYYHESIYCGKEAKDICKSNYELIAVEFCMGWSYFNLHQYDKAFNRSSLAINLNCS